MTRDEIMRMDVEELRLAIAKAKYPKVEMRWCKRDCECGYNEEYQNRAEEYLEMGVYTQEEWEEMIRSGEKRVYQWPCWNRRENDEPSWEPVPDWPASIADAWELVEDGKCTVGYAKVGSDANGKWYASFYDLGDKPHTGRSFDGHGDTAPLAICRAWLMAQEAQP